MKLTVEEMWLGELDELEKEYLKYKNERKIRHLGKKAVKKMKKKL